MVENVGRDSLSYLLMIKFFEDALIEYLRGIVGDAGRVLTRMWKG